MLDICNRNKTLIVIAVIVIAGSSFLYIKHHKSVEAARKAAMSMPAPEVTVTTVQKQDVPLIKEWVGTTEGDVNADIHAKISGYLLKMDYQEGSLVKAGDVMFEIDPRPVPGCP